MGACYSSDARFGGSMVDKWGNVRRGEAKGGNDHITADSNEANRRLEGSSRFVSMLTQQGRKGINQDAMIVCENLNCEKDVYFCAVLDGHGPLGHKVSQWIRDKLPSKLCSNFTQLQVSESNGENVDDEPREEEFGNNSFFSSWKVSLIKSFQEMDENLSADSTLDTHCSGTTTVAVIIKGEHLVVANLGDSRAVLGTRDDENGLTSVQLTVDLKPNLPGEAERIKKCEGRVFALSEEPGVFRLWMPGDNCPGLAMARAFGDFFLKDYGLISTPEVSYRRLTEKDEFVVLATDGIWDVLSNDEVVRIIASARKRSVAARTLVERAIRAWRYKYPTSRVDDCTVICLYFNDGPTLTKSLSEASPQINSIQKISRSLSHNLTRWIPTENPKQLKG